MGHSLLRAPAFQIVVITLLVFLGVLGLRSQGVLEGLEIEAYDWSLRLRSHQLSEFPPITLVIITDQDIQVPLTRQVVEGLHDVDLVIHT